MTRRLCLLLMGAVALAVGANAGAYAQPGRPPSGATAPDPVLAAILDSPSRAQENRVRDPWRHPRESLAFWGLRPGMTVLDIWPAPGYWTEILAPYAKATGGRYLAAQPAADRRLASRFDDAARYGSIAYTVFNKDSGPVAAPNSVDFVLVARNIHDWMWTPGMADKAMADFYAALKPGGVMAVEEHRADPRPMVAEARDGYVNTAFIIALARKAGFELAGQSEINANPKDTKDHPFGVWTLPPTRTSAAKDQPTAPGFDHAKYEAIGESDRMTLRFRKPG